LIERLLKRPEGMLVATFAILILAGTIALRLGVCQTAGRVGWLDCLFTSTSAVCVTGLVTRDTATEFSRTGQTVILILIQLGGLGVMTFAALAFQLLKKQVSFQSQAALHDVFFQDELRGSLNRALRRILLITFVIETLGAAGIYIGLQSGPVSRGGLFHAAFFAISAYCNAGFSIYSDNIVSLRGSPWFMYTLMTLIVCGGLGYTVITEVVQRGWARLRGLRPVLVNWSLNTRVVLSTTAALIVLGTATLWIAGLTPAEQGLGVQFTNALFQSITARTAGFNSINIGALPVTSVLILILLMFIGGSPGGCAGGIKTTTLRVWLARIRARILQKDDVVLLDRRIPHEIVRRAALILAIAVLWNALGVFLLAISEHCGDVFQLEDLIFEQISAFGTVGLSTGVTPYLSPFGKFWICLTMYVGRLGPLTIALVIVRPKTQPLYTLPSERVMIG
jgi:trk system potassium uptake protein